MPKVKTDDIKALIPTWLGTARGAEVARGCFNEDALADDFADYADEPALRAQYRRESVTAPADLADPKQWARNEKRKLGGDWDHWFQHDFGEDEDEAEPEYSSSRSVWDRLYEDTPPTGASAEEEEEDDDDENRPRVFKADMMGEALVPDLTTEMLEGGWLRTFHPKKNEMLRDHLRLEVVTDQKDEMILAWNLITD